MVGFARDDIRKALNKMIAVDTFDEQVMPECDSEALDFRAASESFSSVRKLKRTDLDTLRLMVKHQGRKAPTVSGMLLWGRPFWKKSAPISA